MAATLPTPTNRRAGPRSAERVGLPDFFFDERGLATSINPLNAGEQLIHVTDEAGRLPPHASAAKGNTESSHGPAVRARTLATRPLADPPRSCMEHALLLAEVLDAGLMRASGIAAAVEIRCANRPSCLRPSSPCAIPRYARVAFSRTSRSEIVSWVMMPPSRPKAIFTVGTPEGKNTRLPV